MLYPATPDLLGTRLGYSYLMEYHASESPPTKSRGRWGRWIRSAAIALSALIPIPSWASDCRDAGARPPSAVQQPPYSKGILWKIERSGSAPSYLMGTIHLGDPRVTFLPCAIKERFDAAASFTMELIANGDGFVTMAQIMYYNDERTLPGILKDEALFTRVSEALSHRGVSPEGVKKLKPWSAISMLSFPSTGQTGLFLDMALQFKAIYQRKPVYGLETMEEQLSVFNDLQVEDQISLLREALAQSDKASEQIEAMTLAYLERDLAKLLALEKLNRPADKRAYYALRERLITRRNIVMAERMVPRLKEGNAFIAVGALHLPGTDGVLHLLNEAGYRVTPVY